MRAGSFLVISRRPSSPWRRAWAMVGAQDVAGQPPCGWGNEVSHATKGLPGVASCSPPFPQSHLVRRRTLASCARSSREHLAPQEAP